jgi:hypothetical protein
MTLMELYKRLGPGKHAFQPVFVTVLCKKGIATAALNQF